MNPKKLIGLHTKICSICSNVQSKYCNCDPVPRYNIFVVEYPVYEFELKFRISCLPNKVYFIAPQCTFKSMRLSDIK